MTTQLPYSRTVNVTLSRDDSFATRTGFGTLLFLTSTTVVGVLDASNLTAVYTSLEDVAVDFVPTDDFYKAAEVAFSQNPRPVEIKAGWYDSTTVTTEAAMETALDNIYAADSDWYWLTIESAVRDDDALTDGIIDWVETKSIISVLDSNDSDMESTGDTTSVAGRHKDTVERSSVFYHTDTTIFPGVALAAILSTRDFDEANTAYTAKFKNLKTIPPVDLDSAVVQAITGFTPNVGQSAAAGNMANTYIDIGGQNFVVEGSTLTSNVFIDEIHAGDWIVARTQEDLLSMLLNNERIPFTNNGMHQLASAAKAVMKQAVRAGIIAQDLNPQTGTFEAAVRYDIPSVFDVSEADRANRIAPPISVTFRYAGAVHYTTVNYSMTF